MSTALATIGHAARPMSRLADITGSLDKLWDLSAMLLESRMLPNSIDTPQKAIAIILKGDEIGIPPMLALEQITVIQGKPTISPQLMLALIERSGQLDDLTPEESVDSCVLHVTRKGRSSQVVSFTRPDAVAMGLAGKDNWRKQFGVMMYWRCISKMGRRVFPDIISGLYTPEEIDPDLPVNEDGEVDEELHARKAIAGPKFRDNGSGHGNGSYGTPSQVKASRKLIADVGKEESEKWVDAWVSSNRALPNALTEYPVASATIARIMLQAAIAQGKLQPVEMTADPSTGEEIPKASIEQTHQMIAVVADREPQWFEATLRGAFSQEMGRVANLFVAENPSFSLPPEYEVFDEESAPEDESQDPEPPPAPPAPKRMTKKELAEKTLADIKAKKFAEEQADKGDAYEAPEPGESGEVADAQ